MFHQRRKQVLVNTMLFYNRRLMLVLDFNEYIYMYPVTDKPMFVYSNTKKFIIGRHAIS